MSLASKDSPWQRLFKPGIKLAGIVAAVGFAANNLNNLKSGDFDLVPMNSVLHGIRHSSLPFNHIKVDGTVYNINNFIKKQLDADVTTQIPTGKIQLLTGQVFTSKDVATKPHIDKYYTVVSGDPWDMTTFDQTKNEEYIHYAMGCVEWKDTATSIASVTKTSGGTGYNPGTFDATVTCTGDCTGTGLVAKCVVEASTTVVASVNVLDGGSGYSADNLPTITCVQSGATTQAIFTAVKATSGSQKLVIPHHKTDACQCVTDHLDAWTGGAADTWPKKDEPQIDYELAVIKQCSRRNPNKYNVEYAGAVNSEHIMQAGQGFLLAALVMMFVNSYINGDGTPKSYSTHLVIGGLILSVILIVATLAAYADLRDGSWIAQVENDSMLLTKRNYMGKATPEDFYATGAGAGDAASVGYMSTQTMLRWFTYTAVLVWSLLSILLVVAQSNGNSHSASILFRFVIDIPIIMGLTLAGVSVLLQNGYTNYSYLDLNIFLIICICFMQHMSNVIKMFYDAVCQRTNSEVFKQLYYKGESLEEDESTNEQRQKVTSVLQFFGWFRVWIFLLVTLGTALFLTMTNELVKTTTMGNIFSSQVLVFALVLYLSNVGYDVVRELLPVEFQKYETDHTRFWIITLYLIYYNYNQYSYSEHFLGSLV